VTYEADLSCQHASSFFRNDAPQKHNQPPSPTPKQNLRSASSRYFRSQYNPALNRLNTAVRKSDWRNNRKEKNQRFARRGWLIRDLSFLKLLGQKFLQASIMTKESCISMSNSSEAAIQPIRPRWRWRIGTCVQRYMPVVVRRSALFVCYRAAASIRSFHFSRQVAIL
jgi:hypothetical protein